MGKTPVDTLEGSDLSPLTEEEQARVQKGFDDIKAGKGIPHDEAKRRIKEALNTARENKQEVFELNEEGDIVVSQSIDALERGQGIPKEEIISLLKARFAAYNWKKKFVELLRNESIQCKVFFCCSCGKVTCEVYALQVSSSLDQRTFINGLMIQSLREFSIDLDFDLCFVSDINTVSSRDSDLKEVYSSV